MDGEISELKKEHDKVQDRLRIASSIAQLLPAAAGALGGLTGRLVLGTIAEELSNVVGAVNVEQIESELNDVRKRMETKYRDLNHAINQLHNATENAKSTIEQMRKTIACYVELKKKPRFVARPPF